MGRCNAVSSLTTLNWATEVSLRMTWNLWCHNHRLPQTPQSRAGWPGFHCVELVPVNLVSTAGPECKNPSSAPYSSATHQTELLTLRGGNWMSQSVRQPQLDERLSGYAQSARFPVQGI